ncbi:MAG: hypothetical protein ACREVE_03200 [Gammaproteobacteria bacterium]
MIFFRRRGPKTKRKISPDDDTLPYRSLLAKFEGDLTAFRANDVAMKVWLPEAVDEILKQLSDHWPSSRSEMIRDTLFVYVYGQYAFAQMKAQNDGFFYVDPDRILFSRARGPLPALGKSIKSYKVWMPAKLRDDLKAMAAESGMALSHYVREILISSFMGHLKLPAREHASHQAHSKPDQWPPEPDNSEDRT